MPEDSACGTVTEMMYQNNDPVWVRGERMRQAATVVKDNGATIEVLFTHGHQQDTVSARDVEPRDPAHPANL